MDLKFKFDGYVTSLTYFAKRPGEFVVGVWRPGGYNGYILVAKDYVTAEREGLGVSEAERFKREISLYI